jgi:tetratricopeptide (TPR) repeat protein
LSYFKEALISETEHFGYNCDATAKTLNCIGTVKSLQNEFAEAMESHEEALRILKDCHGEDLKHPLVSETLCQIGSVYYRERNSLVTAKGKHDSYTTFIEGGMLEVIGKAHEDRGSYKMALAFFEEKLQFLDSKGEGRDNLEDAATTLNGLGMLSARAGLLVEAIDYYEKALSIQLQLGCDEVHVATARVLTAAVQFQMGNWHKALKLLQEALIVLQDELGNEHETVAATLYQIGVVQAALCEYDVAMDMLNQALEIQRARLGQEHPATLRTRREIGNLYAVYETEADSAFDLFDEVLDAQRRLYGDRHPNIAETLHRIGCAYSVKNEFSNALRILEECYYMRVEFLGWDHPIQATTLHDIAKIHVKRGRLKKALHICDVVLGLRKDALSERHIDIARGLTTKGSCLILQGDTVAAGVCLTEALGIAKESLGDTHPAVAEIYAEMGCLHLRNCQFDDARKEIQKALDIYCWSSLDDDYPGIKDAKEKLERVERDEMLCV